MSLSSAIYSYLTSKTAVTDLVGTRIYKRGNVPTRTTNNAGKRVTTTVARLPYITYETEEEPEHVTSGHAGLVRGELTLHIFDSNSLKVETLAEAVRDVMDGFEHSTWGSTSIDQCRRGRQVSIYDEPIEGHEGRHRETQPYEVWFLQTAPTFA